MWSIGVIIYVILCGHPPFADDVQSVLFEKIRIGEYDMSSPEWKDISEDAKHLVRSLLNINPQQRWTAKQALNCKWLVEDDPRLDKVVLAETYNLLRKRKSRLKNVAKTIMWMNRHSIKVATSDVPDIVMKSANAGVKDDQIDSPKNADGDDDSTQISSDNEFSEKSIVELMSGASNKAVMI